MPGELKWRTRQLLTCRCQRDVAVLDAKYTKELADAKAENDACVMMLPLVVVSVAHQSSLPSAAKLPRSADNGPDWQTPLNGIISPSERLTTIAQKQPEGTRSILMSSR